MARVPQKTRRDFNPQSLSTAVGGGGVAHRRMAAAFANISAELGNYQARKDQQARIQAAKDEQTRIRKAGEQGRIDGFDPSQGVLTLRPDDSPENIEYNAAATRSYLAKIESVSRDGLFEIYQAHQSDPAALTEKLNAHKAGVLDRVPEGLRGELTVMMDGLIRPYIGRAAKVQADAVLASDKADLQSLLLSRSRDMNRQAYLSDLSPESDVALAGQIDGLRSLLVRHGPKEEFELDGVKYPANAARSGVMTPDGIVTQLSSAESGVRLSRIEGTFGRLDRPADRRRFAEDLTRDFEAGKGLAGQLTADEFEDLRSDMTRAIKADETAQKSAVANVSRSVRDMQSLISSGFVPEGEALAAVRVQVAASGDPDVMADMRALEGDLRFYKGLQNASPAEIRNYTGGARSRDGVSPEEARRVKMAESFLSKMDTELSRDPLSWANRSGRIDLQPIDFEGDITGQIQARRSQGAAVAQDYNLSRVPLFTRDEKQTLTRISEQGGSAMLGLAQALTDGAGSDGLAVLGEISDDAPVLAHTVGVATTSQDAALLSQVAAGLEIRQMDGFKSRLPKKSAIDMMIAENIGPAMAALPKTQAAAIETAKAIYEGEAVKRGVFPDTENVDPKKGEDYKLLQDSLNRALGASVYQGQIFGGLTRVNNLETVAPHFVRAKDFGKIMSSLTIEDFEAVGALPVDDKGRPLGKRDIRNLFPVNVGQGRYLIALTPPTGGDPQYMGAGDGSEPYILDFNVLEPRLRADKRAKYLLGGQ